MYFGIGQIHNAPVPISEIADRMNLTETRIRQIIEDSQNKMRETYSGKIRLA